MLRNAERNVVVNNVKENDDAMPITAEAPYSNGYMAVTVLPVLPTEIVVDDDLERGYGSEEEDDDDTIRQNLVERQVIRYNIHGAPVKIIILMQWWRTMMGK